MNLIRYFYWDMASHWKRDEYAAFFLRNMPGHVGSALRRAWYSRKFKKAGKNLEVYPGAMILNPFKIECGDNVNIGFYSYLQAGGGIILGSNTLMGPYAKIWTQSHRYQDPHTPVNVQGAEFKPVVIGDDVWIGANAFIMPGTVIGDRCVVSANSVVGAKEYPSGSILAGYPARKIGDRSD